ILPILKRIKLFQKKRYPTDMTKINKRRVCYDTIPIRSLKHLVKIIEISKENLKRIKLPLLVMQTKNDRVISNDSGPYIMENTKSKKKKLIEIPESYHVFIIGEYRKEANKHILNFIKNESFD
ncbi:MAG: alpha/beta hydrolase, partial [Nanoarchaeota archaeon]|nr:alpha/beta hydrolase [Nanoarchaeota archaeon]